MYRILGKSPYNPDMSRIVERQAQVPNTLGLNRLDVAASELFPEFSRAKLQEWIKSGELKLDGKVARPKDKLKGGEVIEIRAEILDTLSGPEAISLNIVHEDADLMVINKPSDFVVHPGAGNSRGTLMNALLHHCDQLSAVPRAGIVHRLDKDTTGLLVVAKTLESQTHLTRQLQEKSIRRIYEALVYGTIQRGGEVTAPVGRHPVQRTKMAVREGGREARTAYEIIKVYPEHTHLRLQLDTGRTHQIRVHLQHIRHPIVGDPTYGGTFRQPGKGTNELSICIKSFPRQALHARQLSFIHPSRDELVSFEASLPDDFQVLIQTLDESLVGS